MGVGVGLVLLGWYGLLGCELMLEVGGQSIRQLTETGVLRVDPAVKD